MAPVIAAVSVVQADPGAWSCHACGADLERACAAPRPPCRIDAEMVIRRLEQAGETLLCLRSKSPFPASFRSAMPAPVQAMMDAYGYTEAQARPPQPLARAISRMDAAYQWLRFIPDDRRLLRRIVAIRSLVDPGGGRPLVSWRGLARLVRADHKAVMVWHTNGIDLIVGSLRRVHG